MFDSWFKYTPVLVWLTMASNPIDLPSWKALQTYYAQAALSGPNGEPPLLYLPALFKLNKDRFSKYSLSLNGMTHGGRAGVSILIDYSKNLIDEKVFALLLDLAVESKVEEHRERLFNGTHINGTEDRSVLHMALRNPYKRPYIIQSDMTDVTPAITNEFDKMVRLSNAIMQGTRCGYTGKPITDIVNIGIGGSDLGPRMVCQALSCYAQVSPLSGLPLRVHFVSNVDGFDIDSCLNHPHSPCSPESTLFIIVSKTFTTIETMTNAASAKAWMLKHRVPMDAIGKHFIAVSTNEVAISNFGIPCDDDHIFRFWDWVGGRYSLWSTVGLSILLYIGPDNFRLLLDGAHWMDEHFKNAPLDENAPILLALLGIWYNNFYNCETHAILPYEQALSLLPRYLQQADMESNGKSVTRGDSIVTWSTGPIIWGEPGTNGQHAFYQLIHQGTRMIPLDFLAGLHPVTFANGSLPSAEHHRILLANCIAQSEALMNGTQAPDGRPIQAGDGLTTHRSFAGNKPSTTIIYDKLDMVHLGALIALYEHKIFVQGVIWNIYSFDQWGVELGKKLALTILQELSPPQELRKSTSSISSSSSSASTPQRAARSDRHDASTQGLIDHIMLHPVHLDRFSSKR